MLIWNGTEYKQIRPLDVEIDHDAVHHPVQVTGPLGGHDTVARQGPLFLETLREFLADPNSSYVDGTASYWRMRLAAASGGVL